MLSSQDPENFTTSRKLVPFKLMHQMQNVDWTGQIGMNDAEGTEFPVDVSSIYGPSDKPVYIINNGELKVECDDYPYGLWRRSDIVCNSTSCISAVDTFIYADHENEFHVKSQRLRKIVNGTGA